MHQHGSTRQHSLPLAEADAAHGERRNDIYRLVKLVDGDLHFREFLMWIFNVTDGGRRGTLDKSYPQLAVSPWGLCCSEDKALTTVKRALDLGVVCRDSNRYADGSRKGNSYALDWDGIGRILGHKINSNAGESNHPLATPLTATTPPLTATTPPLTATTPPLPAVIYKEYSPLTPLSKKNVDDVDKKEFSWEEARDLAKEVAALVYASNPGFRLPVDQRDFVMACSVMAIRDFKDRRWLLDAAKAAGSPSTRKKIPFLRTALVNRLTEYLGLCDSDSAPLVFARAFQSALRDVERFYAAKQTLVST